MAQTNNYASGNCTWWASNQTGWVPPSWGDAKNWFGMAQRAGFQTTQTPQQGAVAVWDGGIDPPQGFGHVAVVTAVRPDGSFTVSEMNWKGLGVVDQRNVSDRSNLEGFILPPGAAVVGAAGQAAQSGILGISAVAQAIQSAGTTILQSGQVAGGGLLILVGLVTAVGILAAPTIAKASTSALKAGAVISAVVPK